MLITWMFALISSFSVFSSALITHEFYVPGQHPRVVKDMVDSGTAVVDHVTRDGFELYGPESLKEELNNRGIVFFETQKMKESLLADYPSYQEIVTSLRKLESLYPKIMKLFSIGKSVKGKELWVMKISDNVEIDELEPEFKYISSMHGDEITGRELCVKFIEDLGKNYGKDKRISSLIDQTEIFIMPSMNPDGSEMKRRGNANNVDLNRNFPEWSTNSENTSKGREVENQAVMKWQSERNFSLSANFHGGTIVANYPWDSILDPHPLKELLVELSLAYAEENPEMSSSDEFSGGITNGAEWYVVRGGMQDWSYVWYNDLQITVELSHLKWPSYQDIPRFYDSNKESMLNYLEKIHQGVGVKGKFAQGSQVEIKQIYPKVKSLGTFPIAKNEFYKVLPVGSYELSLKVKNQRLKTIKAEVIEGIKNIPQYLEF